MKKCWAWVKRLWKRLGALLVKIYGLLPLSWQWILAGVLLVGICPLALATDSLLLLWIGLLGGAALVIYGAVNFGTLLDMAKRMRAGNLDIKIDENHMLGAFRDFAVELNGLSDVVQLAAQKQMRSERMRTELITNVSHDIKTPLTSIINYVDLLQKPHSQEEGEKYLEVLSRQSARMKRLIDDLIELSKASTGNIPLELTKIDAVEAVNQALGEFTDKLKAAGLTPLFRQPEEPLYIHADGPAPVAGHEQPPQQCRQVRPARHPALHRHGGGGQKGLHFPEKHLPGPLEHQRRGAHGALRPGGGLPEPGGQRPGTEHCPEHDGAPARRAGAAGRRRPL